ncbi:MAG: DUF1232 domain-containing protein [Acidobacteria bacterium]|nr:DUF1232 domain-containing protein [Acidobacteriota bacterium]
MTKKHGVNPYGGDSGIAEALIDAIREGAIAKRLSKRRATRYYDRIRGKIVASIEERGERLGPAAEFLLFVPDVFMLMFRLLRDPRVSATNKALVGIGIAYYIMPIDILPEAIVGPMGYIDDLILGVFILNKIVNETDHGVVREHWSGQGDVLVVIRRVLESADRLVSPRLIAKIKKMVRIGSKGSDPRPNGRG